MQQTNPHKPITSKENDIVKYVRSLADPKRRKKERAFLIEGVKMVEEALRDRSGVTMVMAAPALVQHHGKGILKLAETRMVDVLWISATLMDSLSESKTPQPVLAVVKMREYSEDSLFSHDSGLIVVAHQLQDPGNLGTIIRTTEAVGASGMAVTAKTVDPYNAKAIRASMGSILRLPIVDVGDIKSFVKTCRMRGYRTIASVLTGDQALFDVDMTQRTAVILGQEGAGLPQDVVADVDVRIHIPMASSIDSLNVATAAAVILYEAMRQRQRRSSR